MPQPQRLMGALLFVGAGATLVQAALVSTDTLTRSFMRVDEIASPLGNDPQGFSGAGLPPVRVQKPALKQLHGEVGG